MMSEGRGCSMRWQKIWSEIENTHFIKIDMVKDSFILLVDVGIASSFDNNTTKKSITNISLMMYSFYGIDLNHHLVCIFLSGWYNTISLFLKKILMYLQFFTLLYFYIKGVGNNIPVYVRICVRLKFFIFTNSICDITGTRRKLSDKRMSRDEIRICLDKLYNITTSSM